jgi:hypothetical protein
MGAVLSTVIGIGSPLTEQGLLDAAVIAQRRASPASGGPLSRTQPIATS